MLSGKLHVLGRALLVRGRHFSVKPNKFKPIETARRNEITTLTHNSRFPSITRLQYQIISTRHRHGTLFTAVGVRYVSTDAPTVEIIEPLREQPIPVLDPIPEPPSVPVSETFDTGSILHVGEPPFESLGLGGHSPVGLIQSCLEYLHVSLDVPWWTTIVIGTVIVRLIIFPLVIVAQRNAAKMNNNLPGLQHLQLKMTEARQSGDQMVAARYAQEMVQFMKEKQINPLKNLVVPLAQMPVFISFFMSLRGMANVPVDSMRTGGLFWFEDLTMPDQFFLLPIITSVTMWATIELGTDAAKLTSQNLQTMKYVLRAMPVVILPFTINFPGAILCYWMSSNLISLMQVAFLRIPTVRNYFKIEPLVKHDPDKLPAKPKPFVQGVKDSWSNMQIAKELEERQRFDDMQFRRAGRGPLIKTYKQDPTKVDRSPADVQAKKR